MHGIKQLVFVSVPVNRLSTIRDVREGKLELEIYICINHFLLVINNDLLAVILYEIHPS